MSRTTDYVLDMVDSGQLEYDEYKREYVRPGCHLTDEIRRLKWEISSAKSELELLEDRYKERGE
jgi:hypothetical protein